jgi:hypothetical protein
MPVLYHVFIWIVQYCCDIMLLICVYKHNKIGIPACGWCVVPVCHGMSVYTYAVLSLLMLVHMYNIYGYEEQEKVTMAARE